MDLVSFLLLLVLKAAQINSQYKCSSRPDGECIPCDCKPDCFDLSDEVNCTGKTSIHDVLQPRYREADVQYEKGNGIKFFPPPPLPPFSLCPEISTPTQSTTTQHLTTTQNITTSSIQQITTATSSTGVPTSSTLPPRKPSTTRHLTTTQHLTTSSKQTITTATSSTGVPTSSTIPSRTPTTTQHLTTSSKQTITTATSSTGVPTSSTIPLRTPTTTQHLTTSSKQPRTTATLSTGVLTTVRQPTTSSTFFPWTPGTTKTSVISQKPTTHQSIHTTTSPRPHINKTTTTQKTFPTTQVTQYMTSTENIPAPKTTTASHSTTKPGGAVSRWFCGVVTQQYYLRCRSIVYRFNEYCNYMVKVLQLCRRLKPTTTTTLPPPTYPTTIFPDYSYEYTNNDFNFDYLFG